MKEEKSFTDDQSPKFKFQPGLIKTPFSLVSFITWTDKMNHLGQEDKTAQWILIATVHEMFNLML